MVRLVLIRTSQGPGGVAGSLVLEGVQSSPMWATAERPWLDNARNLSCIPAGEYEVVRRHYGRYFETYRDRWDHKYSLEVVHPNKDDCGERTAILLHTGNAPMVDSRGCILVGKAHYWRSKDEPCVSRSREAYCGLYDAVAPLLFAGGQNGHPLRPAVRLTIINEWDQPPGIVSGEPGEDAEDVGDRSDI